MRKVKVAINITLDGFCDHTTGIVDDELHSHYADVLSNADTSVMGKNTYLLMKSYWPKVAEEKIGTDSEIRFAENLHNMEKIVVSKKLESVNWNKTRIIRDNINEEIIKLKQSTGKSILIGGPSLISYLTQAKLIDEFNFVIHPFILGKGIQLFNNINQQVELELLDLKKFASGVISTHYGVKSD